MLCLSASNCPNCWCRCVQLVKLSQLCRIRADLLLFCVADQVLELQRKMEQIEGQLDAVSSGASADHLPANCIVGHYSPLHPVLLTDLSLTDSLCRVGGQTAR